MQETPSPDEAQLGTMRWLAAVALAVSAIALIALVAMAWTLTPAQQTGVDQAKAREVQAGALPAGRRAAPGRDDGSRPQPQPVVQGPAARRAQPAAVNGRAGKAGPIGVD